MKQETSPPTNHARSAFKKRPKQSLIATTIMGGIGGVALTAWIATSNIEDLLVHSANYALSGMDSELIDIHLGHMGLNHWQVRTASLRLQDSHIKIADLDIQLEWPKSLEELSQLIWPAQENAQLTHISQKFKRISAGNLDIRLGQSLLMPKPNEPTLDNSRFAFTQMLAHLPAIELEKTTLTLASHGDLPDYPLVINKFTLDPQGEFTAVFSQGSEPFARLSATLSNQEWQVDTAVKLAPLLEHLHQIGLRQSPNSILKPLTDLNNQYQQMGLALEGELISDSRVHLVSGEIRSHHNLNLPKLTIASLEGLMLAPTPALAFDLNGQLSPFESLSPIDKLEVTLAPFELTLQPTAAQQAALLQLLDKPLDEEQIASITAVLTGLKSTEAPVGLAFKMTEPLHYSHSQANGYLTAFSASADNTAHKNFRPLRLPAISLSTLGSKLDAQMTLRQTRLSHMADELSQTDGSSNDSNQVLSLQTDWTVDISHSTPLTLKALWPTTPVQLSWNHGQLLATGQLELKLGQSSQGRAWQLNTRAETENLHNIQISLGNIALQTAQTNEGKSSELNLGSLSLKSKGAVEFSTEHQASQSTNTELARRFSLTLPPLTLASEQLAYSASQNAPEFARKQNPTSAPSTHESRTDITLQDFALSLTKGITLHFADNEPLLSTMQASKLSNKLDWQARQLQIEKLLYLKGKNRKETLLKLDTIGLLQDLNWNGKTLSAHERWQLGNVGLQSQHQLTFGNANTKQPLNLTGQWTVDTSMTQALSLLNQTQPIPSTLNVTGHNQLQAQFKLTQGRENTQFAMQINQSMTELEGFYQDTVFEGGQLQAQCEFNWTLSYDTVATRLSRLRCPKTSMHFALFNPGFPLTDIEVNADIELGKDTDKTPDNWLQQLTGLSDTDVSMTAKGNVLSGRFLLPEFSLKLQDKSHAYLLLQGMSLEEVLRIQPQIGVYADGIFDGVLPVDLVDGKISISGGQLAARAPGGLIAIAGNPAVSEMRQSQPYLDFAFSALEHLEYNQLASSFDMDQLGDAKLLVEVKGRSRGIERPIHLNYAHEENMLQLFRSLQIGNDLQDRIEKAVK